MSESKKRAVDFLLTNHRIVSWLSSGALVSFGMALLCILVIEVALPNISSQAGHPVDNTVGAFLALTLALAVGAMIGATYHVIKNRKRLLDWGVFLAIIWVIPYIGIAVYLGGINLRSVSGRSRGQRTIS